MTTQKTNAESASAKLYLVYEDGLKKLYNGDYEAATKAFTQIVADYPEEQEVLARVRSYLTVCERNLQGHPSEGEPTTLEDLYDRAVFFHNEGDFKKALSLFEEALSKVNGGEEPWHVHYGAAASYARLGHLDAAVESLKQAVQHGQEAKFLASQDPDFQALKGNGDFEAVLS